MSDGENSEADDSQDADFVLSGAAKPSQRAQRANASTDQSVLNELGSETSIPPPSTVGQRRKRQTPLPATPSPSVSPTLSMSSTASLRKQMATQVLSSALSSLDRTDKHTTFGDFVASELRALPPDESDALRMAVMRTVTSFLENRQRVVSQSQQPILLIDDKGREVPLQQFVIHSDATAIVRPTPRRPSPPQPTTVHDVDVENTGCSDEELNLTPQSPEY